MISSLFLRRRFYPFFITFFLMNVLEISMRILSILARPMPDRRHAGDLSFLAKGEPIEALQGPQRNELVTAAVPPAISLPDPKPGGIVPCAKPGPAKPAK